MTELERLAAEDAARQVSDPLRDEDGNLITDADSEAVSAAKAVDRKISRVNIRELFTAQNIDIEAAAIQEAIAFYGGFTGFETWASKPENQAMFQTLLLGWADQYPLSTGTGSYAQATEMADFGGPQLLQGASTPSELAGVDSDVLMTPGERFDRNPDTGWIRYKNGVLVGPEGQVAYDPSSKAPGSPQWMLGVGEWSEEEVKKWRVTLQDLGYLEKTNKPSGTADAFFKKALSDYQAQRYLNGGKPMAWDAAAGAGGAGQRLFDVEDIAPEIRNVVRDNYTRVYGVEPSDQEVTYWSQFIFRQTMELQRKFRGKYDDRSFSTAYGQAEESFIEELEGAPKAQMLLDSARENTELHDSIQSAIYVTQGLSG
jgi:hypothetical protein